MQRGLRPDRGSGIRCGADRFRSACLAAESLPLPSARSSRRGAAAARAPVARLRPPRLRAPKDFTGYWVAVVTEHWHLRMEMPPQS